jgi:hypothetical protein
VNRPLANAAQTELDPAEAAAAAARLAAAQNERVAKLQRFYAAGTITLRWIEKGRKRMEQGNIELWRDGERLAMRIYKAAIGEEFLWLGTDGHQCWVFDLRERDAVTLTVRDADRPEQAGQSTPIVMTPAAIVELMGLGRLPSGPSEAAVVDTKLLRALGSSSQSDQLIVSTVGRTGSLRMHFDIDAQVPVRVELLGADGAVAAHSELPREQYESVEFDDMPPGAYPKLPLRVVVREAQDEDQSIKIELGTATGRADQANFTPRLFDLAVLTRRFQPVTIDSTAADHAPTMP